MSKDKTCVWKYIF